MPESLLICCVSTTFYPPHSLTLESTEEKDDQTKFWEFSQMSSN